MVDSDTDSPTLHLFSIVLLFSLVSVILLMFSLLLLGSLNNFALWDIMNVATNLIDLGIIPEFFRSIVESTAEGLLFVLPFMDIAWFGSFLLMSMTAIIVSYFGKRANYFNVFSMATFGIVFFVYIGGIIVQIVNWFMDDILFKVFPSVSSNFPLLSWYLDNLAIVNLIILTLMVIVNFIDLDFSKFNKSKGGESFNEI